MEGRVTILLENVVERLTKIETQHETQLKKESQIDQVIERLDTIQNRQTQLEHKLSDVSTQLEQEKVFMRDQLKEAQDEILHRLTELQQQNVSTRSQAVSVGEEMKQLQATAGPNPVKETAEFCSQADGDVMDDRLAKMSETLEQSVQAVTRAEHVWLDNRTKQCISELSDKVGELAEETSKIVEAIKKENKDMTTDFQIDVCEEIKAQNEPMMKEIQESLTEIAEKHRNSIIQQREDMKIFYTEIVTKVEKTSAELLRTLDEVKKEIKDHMEMFKEEIIADTNTAIVKVKDEYIETQNQLLQDVHEQIQTKGKESMEKVTDELGKVKEELCYVTNSEGQKLREVINSQDETIQNIQTNIQSTLQESVDKVHTDLEKNKSDLVALVEGQSQIVRDRIAGPLPQHKKYVCDFFIENFRQLVRSGKEVTSLPWHINQFDSSVCGNADFPTSGKMKVWLLYNRHPRELGLQPRSAGVRLKTKAFITDLSGKLPDLVVGETTHSWTEEGIKNNWHSGKVLGEMSCDKLTEKGYGQEEDYNHGALLVRYEIEVL